MKNVSQKAVFLDRDGVINEDTEWVSSPEELKIYPFASDAIKFLNQNGFLVIVVTNQSVIARGLCTFSTLSLIHEKMEEEIARGGGRIDAIFFCPHHPDYGGVCKCRKPATGLIDKAIEKFCINRRKSYIIGDKTSDIQTGINAGLRTILVKTGKAGTDRLCNVHPDMIEDDLLKAAREIVKIENENLFW